MQSRIFIAQDLSGSLISNPTVHLYLTGTTTPVAGLEDANGNSLSNPFTGSPLGQIQVAAPDGEYDLRVMGVGRDFTQKVTFLDERPSAVATLRADLASTDEGKGADLVGFMQSGAGAVPRVALEKMREAVSIKDFGAKGDGTTDDTAAWHSALDSGETIFLSDGIYRLTEPVEVVVPGQRIINLGNKNNTILHIDHVDGPGLWVRARGVTLSAFRIRGSDYRQAYGSDYELENDLFGLKIFNANGSLTQCRIDQITTERHPNSGCYMGGEGAGTLFVQCESSYNRGHAFAFDDRTIGGGASSRCGIVNLDLCRAIDNGGNALHLSQNGFSCYRFGIESLETIWNAWNTDIAGLENCEAYIGGENHRLSLCAFADSLGDGRTIMANGDARVGKTVLSEGIFLRSSANNIEMDNTRFISTSRGVRTGTGIKFLDVKGGYFTQQQLAGGSFDQFTGFLLGNDYERVTIDVPSSDSVQTMVDSNTAGARVVISGKENYLYGQQGSPLTGAMINLVDYVDVTIASQVANVTGKYVTLNASANTNLIALVRAGSANLLPPGMEFRFINVSAFTITIKHGISAGYIRTKDGSDLVVAAGHSFSIFTDPSGNPFVI